MLHQALDRQEFTKAEAAPTVCLPVFPKVWQNQKNPDNSQLPDHLLTVQEEAVAIKGFSPSNQEQSH